jgi:quercetin dioxygenase-like cupin family protein
MANIVALRKLADAPEGDMGQTFLAQGERVAMRHWYEGPSEKDQMHTTDYETVGFAIGGRATLEFEDESHELTKGTSWLVPAGKMHRYVIHESFTAVEATAPPARQQ